MTLKPASLVSCMDNWVFCLYKTDVISSNLSLDQHCFEARTRLGCKLIQTNVRHGAALTASDRRGGIELIQGFENSHSNTSATEHVKNCLET